MMRLIEHKIKHFVFSVRNCLTLAKKDFSKINNAISYIKQNYTRNTQNKIATNLRINNKPFMVMYNDIQINPTFEPNWKLITKKVALYEKKSHL